MVVFKHTFQLALIMRTSETWNDDLCDLQYLTSEPILNYIQWSDP